MKTYKERAEAVTSRIQKKKAQRRTIAAVCIVLVLMVTVGLLWPNGTFHKGDGSVAGIGGNVISVKSYDDVAKHLRQYFNNHVDEDDTSVFPMAPDMNAPNFESDSAAVNGNGAYKEVTDNQVDGVTEADLFKRTDKYFFYLKGATITAYSIAGEASGEVGNFLIAQDDEMKIMLSMWDHSEMYLSEDGNTLTVILQRAKDFFGTYTLVVSVDVSDPTAMQEVNRQYVSGVYQTSRMVDGKLILFTRYGAGEPDWDDYTLETFVPHLGMPDQWIFVDPNDIFYAKECCTNYYSVVTTLEAKDLQVIDSVAGLGYLDDIYVSENHIFVSDAYTLRKNDFRISSWAETEIACIAYADGQLSLRGTVTVEGTVKDQYSMDEHEGVLRVVTSIHSWNGAQYENTISASLYCISLETMEVIASVEKFAPQGETAQSVRFDGDMAYVCTAEVVRFTDPVFFFDLSYLENITWTDTGVIAGYSTSLIQLDDGYLLGIGYEESRYLKVEVYAEKDGKVESVGIYQRACDFSEEYKSYFIDRETNQVGLAVQDWNGEIKYLLLQFDETGLHLQKDIVLPNAPRRLELFRADIIDGYLYILSTSGMTVEKTN